MTPETTLAQTTDLRFVWRTIGRLLLPVWFVAYGIRLFHNLATHDFLFIDVEIYRSAAAIAIAGGDPWSAAVDGVAFAAPPPSLLPFIPLTFIPLPVATVIVTVVLIWGAIAAVRRLRLPLWWALFPPIFEGIAVGNLDGLVLILLLIGGSIAGLGGVVKVYGVVPLLLQRRWAAVGVAVAISSLTLAWWPQYIANFTEIIGTLNAQSEGFSAWGTWFVMPTVIALWSLRRVGASWLVVPGLWPDTQIHYAAMSLPAIHRYPLAAAIIGLASPLSAPVAIVVMAIQSHWRPVASVAGRDG